jgi:acid phosphatase
LKFSKQNRYLVAALYFLLIAIAAFGTVKYSNLIGSHVTVSTTTIATTTIPKSTSTATMASPPQFIAKHVIVVFLEDANESYVLGNPNAPYINNMLMPNYSTAEDYYGVAHPSLPNYIAMVSGSTFAIDENDFPTLSLSNKNLVDLLSEKDITWKAYMESMPGGSCNAALSNEDGGIYGYYTKHDPFVYFKDIMDNLSRCSRIVPLTQFGVDLASDQLPDFSFITANILDDGHTAPPAPQNKTTCPPSGTALQCSDSWLNGFLSQVVKNPVFANTIIFVTWDESAKVGNNTADTNPNNRVLLIAVSPHSKKGFVDNSTLYSHYSLLATIEEIYGLGNLGKNDTTANVLNDLFLNDTV